MSGLIHFLSRMLSWLLDALLYIPRKVFELLADAFAALAGSLALPFDTSALGGIPSGVVWFLDFCAVPQGFALVMTALLARFALKLIPTLGF